MTTARAVNRIYDRTGRTTIRIALVVNVITTSVRNYGLFLSIERVKRQIPTMKISRRKGGEVGFLPSRRTIRPRASQ